MKRKSPKVILLFVIMLIMMLAMSVTTFAEAAPKKQQVELVKASASGKKAVKLTWKKIDGAKQYIVYGQLDGKKYKKIATVKKSKNTYTVKKIAGKTLIPGKVYKFKVVAKTSNGKVTSNDIKFITGNKMSKYANVKSIKVNKSKAVLEVGKTQTLKVTKTMYSKKKHLPKKYGAATRYISDTPSVAKVSTKGVIKAVAPGTATIYAQDLGGLYKTIKVTVNAPIIKYNVTFDMKGYGIESTIPLPIKGVISGSTITRPKDPIDNGCAFAGWYKDSECNSAWDFAKDTVTKDITLYAKWNVKTLKAVYVESDQSLTFYYDAVDHSNEGTVYEGDTGDNYLFDNTKSDLAKWGYDIKRGQIKKVEIDPWVADYKGFESTAYMFANMTDATTINGETNIDTKNVTDMSHMFERFGASAGSGLEFAPSVTDWNVENVVDMSYMFHGYGIKAAIMEVPDVSKWKTSSVTNLEAMFADYAKEGERTISGAPDVSGFDISKVKKMGSMFAYFGEETCQEFELDLSKWDLKDVTDASGMFAGEVANCSSDNWRVTIPAETGSVANTGEHWYYGDGTESIEPSSGKNFSLL